MESSYSIRRLPAGLWQVTIKFADGRVEERVGFNSESEARLWVRDKLAKISPLAA